MSDSKEIDGANNTLLWAKITPALNALAIPVSEREVEGLLGNRVVTSIDLAAFKSLVQTAKQVRKPTLDEVLVVSQQLFSSENSKISLQDLKHLLSTIGDKLHEQDLDELLRHLHVDSDGFVTADDLKRVLNMHLGM